MECNGIREHILKDYTTFFQGIGKLPLSFELFRRKTIASIARWR